MTTTLIFAAVSVLLAGVLVYHHLEERSKRRDREIVRRIHTYMAALPPRRPW